MNRWLKGTAVIIGAVVFSTLAINASDVVRGLNGSLSALVPESAGPCGAGAMLLQFGSHVICVDIYEASPDVDCPVKETASELHTRTNVEAGSCKPVSRPEALPWRFVSLTQAQQLCARAGKRLPTNEEWYKAASGLTNIDQCVISERGGAKPAGTNACVTPSGLHDMVGNVWEWVDAEVNDGQYQDRALPPSGFVALVDTDGVALETSSEPQPDFGEDYVNTNDSGVRGMIRGGFWGSETDAGLFALNAAVTLDLKTAGIGFRCVSDIF